MNIKNKKNHAVCSLKVLEKSNNIVKDLSEETQTKNVNDQNRVFECSLD
jgi:hypothetical protein